jgi:two-component system cell cycle sensor histidine kinase/response regulator CckA
MRRVSPKRRGKSGPSPEATGSSKPLLSSDVTQQEALYRSLVERIPGIVYISEFGATAQWHYVSPQVQDLLGYTPQEWLADSTLWLRHVHPDDRELVLAEERRLQETGKAFFAEYRMVARDGRVLWFRDESMILRETDSRPALLYGILYDISERKATEYALRESEERLRMALEAAHLGMWEWDPETDAIFWDERQCELCGLTARDAPPTSTKFIELVNPEDHHWVRHAVREALRTGGAYGTEYRVRWPDGSEHWLASAGRVLHDSSLKKRRMRGITYDVTDRRSLEDHLRRAQKMEAIGQLAGGVAHDFNNLLMVIHGHVELLLDRPGLEPAAARNAEAIQKAADRAAGITQQLLAFSRKQVLQPRVVELRRVVSDISTLLRRLLGSNIEYRLHLPPSPLWVRADESQLEQVVLNLVINARDAMPNGGIVTVELDHLSRESPALRRHPGMPPIDHVRLRVSDTGFGMDTATQARIFEPFFTTKEFGKGTGLGLATVYGIVKQSEGWIWVDSAPGSGTMFEILLPAVAEPAQETPASPQKYKEPRGSETVLLVDDEEGVREVAMASLSAQGYRVLAAESGTDALKLAAAESGPIHALVTDAVMPGMNGPELARRLRESRPQTRVLYISGYAQDASVLEDAMRRGEAFLQKPFSLDALAQKVRTLLSEEQTPHVET